MAVLVGLAFLVVFIGGIAVGGLIFSHAARRQIAEHERTWGLARDIADAATERERVANEALALSQKNKGEIAKRLQQTEQRLTAETKQKRLYRSEAAEFRRKHDQCQTHHMPIMNVLNRDMNASEETVTIDDAIRKELEDDGITVKAGPPRKRPKRV